MLNTNDVGGESMSAANVGSATGYLDLDISGFLSG